MPAVRWWTLLLFGCGLAGCADNLMTPNPSLEGGVLATFRVEGEVLNLWTTNAGTVEDLYALQAGTSQADIPNGPIRAGPGQGSHNLPWSWHLDPEQTVMVEQTVEVCDGTPSYVEDHLSDWVTLGHYCPWGAVLVELKDYR